jgi:hypothetical protein
MHMSKDYHLLRKFEAMFSDTNRYFSDILLKCFPDIEETRQESIIVC